MIKGYSGPVTYTGHAVSQIRDKGFDPEAVVDAIRRPYKITKVSKHPGHLRYCGSGVAVVMDGGIVITVYLDGIVTPLRPDQANDPDALASKRLNQN